MNALDEPQIRYATETPPEIGAAVEIVPGIHWLRLPLPMALDHVNIYALEDRDGWTLIDTGIDTSKSRAIWDVILNGPLAGRRVSKLIVTHHHPDHIGLAGWFQDHHGAELLTTRTAWLMTRMLILDEQERPDQKSLDFWRGAGMAPDILTKRASSRPFNFADCVSPLTQGYTRLQEGEELTIGGRRWHVRMGHGHAPEQATLWCEQDGIVLGADQLLPSISPNIGLYPNEPEADPLAEWIESCAKFSELAHPGQLILPGHKLPYRGLPTRLRQLEENHIGALDRLRDFLRAPHSAVECFPTLFIRQIGETEYGLALVEAMAHLQHLRLRGEITRYTAENSVWRWVLSD